VNRTENLVGIDLLTTHGGVTTPARFKEKLNRDIRERESPLR